MEWLPKTSALFAICLILAARLVSGQTNAPVRVEFREPRITAYLIEPVASRTDRGLTSTTVTNESWTEATVEGTTNVLQLGRRVVLQIEAGRKLESYLAGYKLTLARSVSSNVFILQAGDSQSAINAAAEMAQGDGVIASYPVMRRPVKKHNVYSPAPDDPLFHQQWHLENRGSDWNRAGVDLNVRAAWPVTRGENVLVAVADDGFQLDHPKLKNPASGAPHYNFYKSTSDGGPASSAADHATAVAGLITGEANNGVGIAGVAPEAHLASWVIFGTSFRGLESFINDEQLMDMFQYASNRVAVQNHSWGSTSAVPLPIDVLANEGIENAVTKGRNGKGVVIVRAAGNEREDLINANDDGFANAPRAIAVAAVRKDGRATSYSSPGACLLVGAPSGDAIDSDNDGQPDATDPEAPDLLTTDRTGSRGYNTTAGDEGNYGFFNGTSASSPQVAGVVALILGANPNLAYRDVQQILLLSARHFDLADPSLRFNGAGLRVSHNVGYGVPDAGFAVQLALGWSNRPPVQIAGVTETTRQIIPDDSLRAICSASGIPAALTSIRSLPSLGPHPDDPTPALPLVYVGQANEELTVDLHGKAALIQRGQSFFSDKIARAARAGAAFAIIFNDQGTNQIQAMGGTTFVPIPAVSIGRTDGEAIRDFVTVHSDTTAKLQFTPVVYRLNISDTLICEHVGLRLKTTHSRRSDVRVTLVSPMGMRSLLQVINTDSTRGPADWTYWSTQHFFESSAGEWRIELSDERNTTLRTFPSGSTAAMGDVIYAELIVRGVAIVDSDADGLDDQWEMKWFGSLSYGPKDDPDHDGYNDAREQILGTDPTKPNAAFVLDVIQLAPGYSRFSWPGIEGQDYALQATSGLGAPFIDVASMPGQFPVTEHVLPMPTSAVRFYRVRSYSGSP